MKPYVLIVDDSLTMRLLLSDALHAVGLVAAALPTLAAARVAIARNPPALVLLDRTLPDGDGLALLAELRSAPATAQLPVLILSSQTETEDRIAGIRAGATDYVAKTDDTVFIVRRVRELTIGRTSAFDFSAGPCRVLVVEDNSAYRYAIGSELSRDGHDVVLAAFSEAALRFLAAQRVDCAIVDSALPGTTALEVCRQIQAHSPGAAMPFILLGDRHDPAVRAQGAELGIESFAAKGRDFAVLRERLRETLRRAHEAAARGSGAASALPAERKTGPRNRAVSILDAVVQASGLTPTVGRSCIVRACARAGIDAEAMDTMQLERALEEIRQTLNVVLPAVETERRMRAIAAVAQRATGET